MNRRQLLTAAALPLAAKVSAAPSVDVRAALLAAAEKMATQGAPCYVLYGSVSAGEVRLISRDQARRALGS